jgi:hypothetical protein
MRNARQVEINPFAETAIKDELLWREPSRGGEKGSKASAADSVPPVNVIKFDAETGHGKAERCRCLECGERRLEVSTPRKETPSTRRCGQRSRKALRSTILPEMDSVASAGSSPVGGSLMGRNRVSNSIEVARRKQGSTMVTGRPGFIM